MIADTQAYIASLLWSSRDDEGAPLDGREPSDEFRERCEKDLSAFLAYVEANCPDALAEYEEEGYDEGSFAHDFALTRNRHGAGFWDRGLSKESGAALTAAAHRFGGIDVYVGDDGKVYGA